MTLRKKFIARLHRPYRISMCYVGALLCAVGETLLAHYQTVHRKHFTRIDYSEIEILSDEDIATAENAN